MSVTTPQGFRATGVTAGLKASGRPDVALVVNDGPRFDAAAVFTSNRVEAAPVTWSRHVVADDVRDLARHGQQARPRCVFGLDGRHRAQPPQGVVQL